jgi:translation initiation factor IF-2
MRDMRDMFRRTANVANDRVLTRGNASVHINAGPRYVPGATVARLNTIAPHTFPQRAILPRPGANMSARPWIRAATGGGAPAGGGAATATGGARIGGGAAMGGGHTFGRSFPGHPSAAPASGPHVYNPPRPTAPTGIHGGGQPRTFAPAHGSNPPLTATTAGPRVFDVAPGGSAPRAASRPTTYGAPHTMATPPAHNASRVYNPSPRTFDTPAAVNPVRPFSTPSAGIHNPPPRTFAAPAPMQPFHQTHAPMQTQVAPARSFSPPALAPAARSFSPPAPAPAARSFSPPAAGGGFGRPGGGAPFSGGGHRR